MVFSSIIFIFIFLPIVLLAYYTLGNKIKNYILLVSSFIFYAWGGVEYLKILVLSILINYIFGLLIDKSRDNILIKKVILSIGVLINLSFLFYFKYYNFFAESVNSIFNTNYSIRDIVLPIGISFFTFQGMSYIIDIYRNDAKVNKNPFAVALYMSFFPNILSGPIVKYKTVGDEVTKRKESIEYFSYGINRFVLGLAKKVIIADVLGAMADNIFNLYYTGIDTPTAWIGALCYTFQIYFDFSGYSDSAIGLGYMFGFKTMENFNYPYISKSITEFWRRWHISLSTWFKEYLYIPLGGNRRGNVYFNLFVVFLVTGIWHGANWTFILWGLWHGLFILIERAIKNKKWYIKTPNIIKHVVTMLIVILGWVLFRAENIEQGLGFIKTMFGFNNAGVITFEYSYFINKKFIFWMIISIIGSLPFISNKLKKYNGNVYFEILSTIGIALLFIVSIIFIVNSTYSPFIYFQF